LSGWFVFRIGQASELAQLLRSTGLNLGHALGAPGVNQPRSAKKIFSPRDFFPRPGLSFRNRGVNAWVCPSKDSLANPSAKAASRLGRNNLLGG
jgi:hypothetical protein